MTRRAFERPRSDWRRDHMWVGKGVPFWLAVLGIAALAWVGATWFG
jgi:hypothetical protein